MSSISSLRLAILCLILKAPRSGYDLKKEFEESPMGHFSASPGAIYPALKRMEEEGWIAGAVDNPESLRPARILSLTDAGRDLLKREFLRPLDEQDLIWRMDQLMLRFAFMTPLVGRAATCGFLDQLIEAISSYLHTLREISGELANEPPEGVLALQHGIAAYESTLEWARHARKTLGRIQ